MPFNKSEAYCFAFDFSICQLTVIWAKYAAHILDWPECNVAFHSEIKGFVGSGWLLEDSTASLVSHWTSGVAVKMVSSIESIFTPVLLLSPPSPWVARLKHPRIPPKHPRECLPNAFHIFLIILSVVTPLLKVCCSCKKYLILGRSTISFGSYLNLFSSKKWTTQAAFLSLR